LAVTNASFAGFSDNDFLIKRQGSCSTGYFPCSDGNGCCPNDGWVCYWYHIYISTVGYLSSICSIYATLLVSRSPFN
jgi:hypothetical protein